MCPVLAPWSMQLAGDVARLNGLVSQLLQPLANGGVAAHYFVQSTLTGAIILRIHFEDSEM